MTLTLLVYNGIKLKIKNTIGLNVHKVTHYNRYTVVLMFILSIFYLIGTHSPMQIKHIKKTHRKCSNLNSQEETGHQKEAHVRSQVPMFKILGH